VVVCNVEVLFVFILLVDAAAVDLFDADICGCLVDLTERWIDCLLLELLLAIEDEEEEVVALQFVVLVDDDAGVDLDLESLILSAIISLLLFLDLYCRVDLDCLVVVVANIC